MRTVQLWFLGRLCEAQLDFESGDRGYSARDYFVIELIDLETGMPVDFTLQWNYEENIDFLLEQEDCHLQHVCDQLVNDLIFSQHIQRAICGQRAFNLHSSLSELI